MHSRGGLLGPTSRHHAYVAWWMGYAIHSRSRTCGCPGRRGRPARPVPQRINSMKLVLHLTFSIEGREKDGREETLSLSLSLSLSVWGWGTVHGEKLRFSSPPPLGWMDGRFWVDPCFFFFFFGLVWFGHEIHGNSHPSDERREERGERERRMVRARPRGKQRNDPFRNRRDTPTKENKKIQDARRKRWWW